MTRIIPTDDWFDEAGRPRYQPYPENRAAMDWLMRNRKTNGFWSCALKIGRRTCIDEEAFVRWARSHAETEQEPAP